MRPSREVALVVAIVVVINVVGVSGIIALSINPIQGMVGRRAEGTAGTPRLADGEGEGAAGGEAEAEGGTEEGGDAEAEEPRGPSVDMGWFVRARVRVRVS